MTPDVSRYWKGIVARLECKRACYLLLTQVAIPQKSSTAAGPNRPAKQIH